MITVNEEIILVSDKGRMAMTATEIRQFLNTLDREGYPPNIRVCIVDGRLQARRDRYPAAESSEGAGTTE